MNTEEEIIVLQGEVMAHESILIGLLLGLQKLGPPAQAVVVNAFSYAESVTNIRSLKLGAEQPKLHLESALKVIEYIRTSTLGGNGQPKTVV